MVEKKTTISFKPRTNKRKDLIQLLLGIVIVLLINVIGSFVFSRFDLTSEKRYTLSDATKKLIEDLDDVVFVKIYLEGEFPAGFKRLRNETKEMLDEFRAYSKGNNIQYEFINPSESSDETTRRQVYQQLVKEGLQPTNLQVKDEAGKSQKIIFPGAIFTYKGRSMPLQLLKSQIGGRPEEMLNNSVQALEYEISNTIRKLAVIFKPKVAFIEGHGELPEASVADITHSLSEYYNVTRIRINEQLNSLQGIKAIIIAKPDSAFSEKDKFIIDQFIMRGGRVLWLIETVMASMDSLGKGSFTVGLPYSVNLEDQLFKYGVRINTNLIQDIQAAPIPIVTGYVGNQPQQSLYPWFYFPLILPTSKHPIVNNLNAIKLEFANSMDTIGTKGVKKTILLRSSQYSKLQNAPARISLGIIEHEPKREQFNKPFQTAGVLLEGEFQSPFKNRLPESIIESKDIVFNEKSGPNKMIVVSDGDIIKNQFNKTSGEMIPMGYDRYTGQEYGNRNFILNCLNYLCDDSGLISVRSREVKLRLLDKTKIEAEKSKWQVLNVAAPILLIWLFGVIWYYLRNRKYSK